jgi:hypothetical protein
MKPTNIYQKLFWSKENKRYEWETLEVFKSKEGLRITCLCLSNLYHKGRDVNANCYHAKQLREAIQSNNLTGWKEVSPK